jgi:enoyl-CoA hydratase
VLVLTSVDDGIAVLTLNRPEARNALSPELVESLHAAVAALEAAPGVDLKRLAGSGSLGPTPDVAWRGPLPPHRKPVIGAINGPTVTGGLELALACDFLIASERATFADTHARVGVMPGWGLTVRLPEVVGINRARQMSFTGDFIDAQRAYEWGLVNEVVEHGSLLARATAVAAAVTSIPPGNVQEIRAIYGEVNERGGPNAWEHEARRSQDWMAGRFDHARLAAQHEAIIERGRAQQ